MTSGTVTPFNPRLVIGMIAAGLAAFAALLLLLAFGGGAGHRPEGRADVQSVAATGYKGLVTLVGEFHDIEMVDGRTGGWEFNENLLVVALERDSRPEQVSQLLERRAGRATLLILPKWMTVADPRRRGWVRPIGTGAGANAGALFSRKLRVASAGGDVPQLALGEDILGGLNFPVPLRPQLISGEDLTTLADVAGQGALVARLGNQPHYIVADPDLLNNQGLRDPVRARSALMLIEALNMRGAKSVGFDVSSDQGAGSNEPNLLRLAFEPPFLAMAVALAFAALLAGLHGAFRFGPTRPEERAVAFGKAALVENGAALIRLARREVGIGRAYADVVRQDAARATAATSWQSDEEINSYLDRISKPDRPRFSQLADDLGRATDRDALVGAAQALFRWKKEIIR